MITDQKHQRTLLIDNSGLAWHTDEGTLRQKFEEFGAVDEAVRRISRLMAQPDIKSHDLLVSLHHLFQLANMTLFHQGRG